MRLLTTGEMVGVGTFSLLLKVSMVAYISYLLQCGYPFQKGERASCFARRYRAKDMRWKPFGVQEEKLLEKGSDVMTFVEVRSLSS